jgi:hypothetical protein
VTANVTRSIHLVVPLALIVIGSVVFASIGLYMIAFDDDDDVLTGIMVSAILATVFSGVVFGAGIARRQGRMSGLMIISTAIAPAALLAWLAVTWTTFTRLESEHQHLLVLALLLTLASVGPIYTALMTLQPTRSVPLRVMRWLTIASAWLFGSLLTAIATIACIDPELLWRWRWPLYMLLQMLGLTTVVGSLIIPLAVRNHARRQARPRESISSTMRMEIHCPRCGIDLEVMQGPARCDACGLTMMIEIEEPRCECGYLSFALTTDTCPECGRSIGRTAPCTKGEPQTNAVVHE